MFLLGMVVHACNPSRGSSSLFRRLNAPGMCVVPIYTCRETHKAKANKIFKKLNNTEPNSKKKKKSYRLPLVSWFFSPDFLFLSLPLLLLHTLRCFCLLQINAICMAFALTSRPQKPCSLTSPGCSLGCLDLCTALHSDEDLTIPKTALLHPLPACFSPVS